MAHKFEKKPSSWSIGRNDEKPNNGAVVGISQSISTLVPYLELTQTQSCIHTIPHNRRHKDTPYPRSNGVDRWRTPIPETCFSSRLIITHWPHTAQTAQHDRMIRNWLPSWQVFNRIKVLRAARVLDAIANAAHRLIHRFVHSNAQWCCRRIHWRSVRWLTYMRAFAWAESGNWGARGGGIVIGTCGSQFAFLLQDF